MREYPNPGPAASIHPGGFCNPLTQSLTTIHLWFNIGVRLCPYVCIELLHSSMEYQTNAINQARERTRASLRAPYATGTFYYSLQKSRKFVTVKCFPPFRHRCVRAKYFHIFDHSFMLLCRMVVMGISRLRHKPWLGLHGRINGGMFESSAQG